MHRSLPALQESHVLYAVLYDEIGVPVYFAATLKA
jgi:hypothetical protein